MAKSHSSKNTLGMLAFGVMLLTGICKILEVFKIGGGIVGLVADVLLVIVVVWTAYSFAMSCKKPWRIIYWVLAILCIAAIVLASYNPF